jgi:peptide/nickel transport system permease protein
VTDAAPKGGLPIKGDHLKSAALASLAGMAICAFLAMLGLLLPVSRVLAWILLAAAGLLVAAYITLFQRAMLSFLGRRLLLMTGSFLGITVLTFFIIRAAPGDPVTIQMGPGGEGGAIDASKLTRDPGQAVREQLYMIIKHPFTAKGVDPDGDPIQLIFTWGDGSPESRAENSAPSGSEQTVAHHFVYEGDYEVRARVVDRHGFESEPSDPVPIRIREKFEPPSAPAKPIGPARVRTGDEVSFSSEATTADGSEYTLLLDWGEGTLSPPSDPVPSGGAATRKTTYVKSGLYRVRALARGKKGALSKFSEPVDLLVEEPGRPYARPARPGGPAFVHLSEELDYGGRSAADAEIEVDWGDGTTGRTKPGTDGTWKLRHKFAAEGRHFVRARHADATGASAWSDELTVLASSTNHRPDRPAPPRGPTEGAIKTTIAYQYARWFADLLRLDFRRSTSENRDVWLMIQERLPRTLFLDIVSFALIYAIAVPIGIYSSTHRRTVTDRFLTLGLFMLYSLPTFWVATMLIAHLWRFRGLPLHNIQCNNPGEHYTEFGSHLFVACLAGIAAFIAFLRWERTRERPFLWSLLVSGPFLLLGMIVRMPWSGLLSPEVQDRLWHSVLPVVVLSYPSLAALSRYARSGMLEVVRQDYIRTARAKGLQENVVILRHALRNGMIPILTLMATILPTMISGSIIVEFIFNIQGMGLMAYDGVTKRDYPVIMAVTTLSAVLTLVGLLISDILYVLVDPRISFESKTDE